jgi:hypothetical protein
VERAKIAESGEYNLSGDRYQIVNEQRSAQWTLVYLRDIAFMQEGPGILSSQYASTGYPIVNVKTSRTGFWIFRTQS